MKKELYDWFSFQEENNEKHAVAKLVDSVEEPFFIVEIWNLETQTMEEDWIYNTRRETIRKLNQLKKLKRGN